MKTTLIHTDIWRCGSDLYCKQGDGQLIRIQSNRIKEIIDYLTYIQKEGRHDDYCPEGLERKDAGQIIRFLLDNHIISLEDEEKVLERHIGFFGSDEMFEDLEKGGNPQGLCLHWHKIRQKEGLDGLNFILVTTPVFEHCDELIALSNSAYKRCIPLMYSELTPTNLTLGPLVCPQDNTASLHCYIKRKKVNLKHPEMYAEFIGSSGKEAISTIRMRSFSSYPLGLAWIRMELEKILRFHFKLSGHLIEHSYSVDFTSLSMEDSRVLKDPLSPLFHPAHYVPFNG